LIGLKTSGFPFFYESEPNLQTR